MMTELERNAMREEVLAEIRKVNREYKKEWRKKNPDKVKAANERYWLKKAKELMEKEVK